MKSWKGHVRIRRRFMLRVQHDWITSFKVDLEPFWVNSVNGEGQVAREGSVIVQKDAIEARCVSPAGFNVSWQPNLNRLEVQADGLRSSFYAATHAWVVSSDQRGKKRLFSLGLSPEGGLCASGAADGQLRVWESQDGTIRRDLIGHHGDINACLFFPSGEVILTASADRFLKIWSATEGYCAADLKGHALGVLGCDIIDRGRNVVSCSRDGTAKLWDVGTQECIANWEVPGCTLNAITTGRTAVDSGNAVQEPIHPKEAGTENKLLFVAAEDGALYCYDIRTRNTVFRCAAGSAVNCVKAAGTSVTAGTDKGAVHTWDIRSLGMPRHTINHTRAPVTGIALGGESNGWVVGADGLAWRWAEGQPVTSYLSGPDCDRLQAIAAITRGTETAIYTAGRDGLVRKYSVPSP